MLLDFNTGKIIETDKIITVTQSLVKSTRLLDSSNIDFNHLQNNNWEEVFQNNGVLSPKIILENCKHIIESILNKKDLDKVYCKFIYDQCSNWIVSDQFATIENK